MNPRLRVALAALPVITLGLLAWLPFLWLYITRPLPTRQYGRILLASAGGTLCVVFLAVTAGDNEPLRAFTGCLLLAHVAATTVLAWTLTAEVPTPVKDPYA